MSTFRKTMVAAIFALLFMPFVWGQIIVQNKAENESTSSFIQFKNLKKYTTKDNKAALYSHLNAAVTDDFLLKKTINTLANFRHFKYQQYHKSIRVQNAIYTVHSKDDHLYAMSGNFLRINETFDATPSISKNTALKSALDVISATRYKWQSLSNETWIKNQTQNAQATYYPQGELVIMQDVRRDNRATYHQPVLVYKFDIYAEQPLSRAEVYVDAHTGEVVHQNSIIKHAVQGICHTKYSGIKALEVEQLTNDFRLHDDSRGSGITTLNLNNTTTPSAATDYIDNDNNWAEWNNAAQDNAALDAHYGAQATYDFFFEKFDRNSFDDGGAAIYNYVHFGNNQANAIWDGEAIFYGDGNTNFSAFTSLDIVAHELAHALCEHTANLDYSYESGALNEGLSDIWAACVERSAEPSKSTWLIGEDIVLQGDATRSMSNPNAENQPDTYGGTYWHTTPDDNGGVHANSGVINHWFYLLAEGGTGTNDYADAYQITPIGIEAAARIVYRTETVYLSPMSNFSSMRVLSIQAAEDLFGACSQAVISVANAWYAVGVGGYSECISGENYCHSQGNQQAYEWLANVTIDDFTKYSAASTYSNFTNYIIDLPAGDSTEISLTPGYSGTATLAHYRVWIDFNHDGDFEDANEEVFTAGPTNIGAEGKIYIPPSASDTTRMRVSMCYGGSPPLCGNFAYGEVEDYTLIFHPATVPTCDDGIQNGNETGVDCGGDCIACLPENPYCEASAMYSIYQWIDYVGTTATNGNLSGNDGGYRDFSNTIFGVTRGTIRSFFFSKGDANYRFYWRIYIDFNQDDVFEDTDELVISGASESSNILSANAYIPTDASLGTTRMRVVLSSSEEAAPCGAFAYGEVEDYMIFIGNEFVYDDAPSANYFTTENENSTDEFAVFPNPTSGILHIKTPKFEGVATAKIYDWSGRLVRHFKLENNQRILNVADWQTGMYLLTVECEGQVFTEKFLKQ